MWRVLDKVLLVFFVLLISTFLFTGISDPKEYKKRPDNIYIKSIDNVPDKYKKWNPLPALPEAFGVNPERYAIIQLDHIPSNEEKKDLQKEGIYLVKYIPENSWIAKVNYNKAKSRKDVVYLSELNPEDKIDPAIFDEGDWYREGDYLFLRVSFFEGSLDKQKNILESYGEVLEEGKNWLVKINQENLYNLASEHTIKWITYRSPPIKVFNNGARAASNVDYVQDTLRLNGTGVVVAEWDQGWAESTHDALTGRIIIGDNSTSGSISCSSSGNCTYIDHSTHVAGTVLGDGTGSADQKGMAPNATLITYEWWDTVAELEAEYNASINNYSAVISQNSWGRGYSDPNDITEANCNNLLGDYRSLTEYIDNVSRGYLGTPITIAWAAGNERSGASTSCGSIGYTYNTITPYATAKNVITVGAVNSNDESMTSFSSWGPTDDGRLKPEVVASGCQSNGDLGINSTLTGNTYGVICGTSMATPVVSGILALIIEDYKDKNNVLALPSTNKAILAHTAKDLNETGPDFTTGYGLVNATAAINLIRASTNGTVLIAENNITSNGQNITYHLYVNTPSELKLTLAWDDYPGDSALTKQLINDLDLVVIAPNGTRYFPWTLDSGNPSTAAVRTKVNNVDVIEQVVVDSAITGVWTINISGSSVPQLNQSFSLISSHDLNYTKPIITLNTPTNGASQAIGLVQFNCSIQDSALSKYDLVNVSLWINSTGWHLNQTKNITGTSNSTIFNLTLPEGEYIWNCEAYNNISESDFAVNNFTLTVSDVPQYANISTDIVSTYTPNNLSLFNITWTDGSGIDNVFIEGNWSGSAINYTMIHLGSGVYHYNTTLPAGTFYWQSHANDTNGVSNSTSQTVFTISKADSGLTLLLNGTNGNFSILEDTTVNLTLQLTESDNVSLYVNGILYQNSSAPYSNISIFADPGEYNITAIYPGNQNYTSNTSTHWLTVNDTTSPTISSASASPTPLLPGDNIIFTATVTDNGVLDAVWVNISNSTFSTTIILANSSGSTFNTSYNTINLSQDTYTVTIFANDTYGNEANSSVRNFIIGAAHLFNISIFDKDGTAQNVSNFIIYYNSTDIERFSATSVNSIQQNLPNGLWDLFLSQANFNLTFLEFNVTANISAYINLDDSLNESAITLPTNFSLFDHVVAINTTLLFTKAQIVIPYNESAFLSESRINALACHSWNLTGQSCTDSWENVTNTSIIDTINNQVTINTTHFSAFAVSEHAVCGDNIKDSGEECDGSDFGSSTCLTEGFSGGSLSCSSCKISTSSCTTASSSSGGNSGGGGSSTTTTTETTQEETEEKIETNKTFTVKKAEGLESNENLQKVIEKILGKDRFLGELKEILLELSEEISENTEIERKAISKEETIITTKISYNGNSLKNFMFYDVVPKSFAQSSDNIIVTAPRATIEIVNPDPEYLFVYDEINSGDVLEINYTINKSLDKEDIDSILDDFFSEVYGLPKEDIVKEEPPEVYNIINILLIISIVLVLILLVVTVKNKRRKATF